jgi:hypothetical protein
LCLVTEILHLRSGVTRPERAGYADLYWVPSNGTSPACRDRGVGERIPTSSIPTFTHREYLLKPIVQKILGLTVLKSGTPLRAENYPCGQHHDFCAVPRLAPCIEQRLELRDSVDSGSQSLNLTSARATWRPGLPSMQGSSICGIHMGDHGQPGCRHWKAAQ